MGKENTNLPLEKYVGLLRRRLENPERKDIIVPSAKEKKAYSVTLLGSGPIITDVGEFKLYIFQVDDEWGNYEVLTYGGDPEALAEKPSLFVRIDSGCESGQTFHDRTCDCREQLHLAMARCVVEGGGAIIHIPSQDGRGQGSAFKMATLDLQEAFNLDTLTAFRLLGKEIDIRTYEGAVATMLFLGIGSKHPIALGTNSPHKVEVITKAGIAIDRTVAIKIPPTELTKRHFQAKKGLGHNLDI